MIQTDTDSRLNARWDNSARHYDALLVLSFGGPEGPNDVMPFMENVTRGRGIPRERLESVAEHYLHFGGVSPINEQNRDLISALDSELREHGHDLPIYFGNRNWRPFLKDTVMEMMANGVERCLVFVTSAFSSYSGCRQYREDIARVVEEIGDCSIDFDKIRVFYNHPCYVESVANLTAEQLQSIPAERRYDAHVVFTAHSIPETMARRSAYEAQLRDACQLVAHRLGLQKWSLAFQSRSGSPQTPWLEPDILEEINRFADAGVRDLAIMPIGFISDHMEILFDLDTEAAELASRRRINMVRVPTVGVYPTFITMVRQLIEERMTESPDRLAVGSRGPNHDICPVECCLMGSTARPTPTVTPLAGAS